MSNVPAPPKYEQLSRLLEARIQRGGWSGGKIPTVREIAEEHRVSVLTASRALQVLQGKGLIQTVERTGIFLMPHSPAPERWGLLLRVSPGNWQVPSHEVVQRGFDELASSGVATFVPVIADAEQTPEETVRQLRKLAEEGVSGVFFLPSRLSAESACQDERFLGICRQEKMPVVLLDRNLRGSERPLEYDLVCSDHFKGGRLSTLHLLEQGRRRVACVLASPTSSHQDREAGYLSALAEVERQSGQEYPRLVYYLPPELPMRAAFGWLAERFLETRADGVLCYQDYTAMGLIVELLRRGVAVPRDLAVIGCDDLPIGQSFSVGVTTYAYPAVEIARQAMRLMRERIHSPDTPPVKVMVPGQFIVRDSSVQKLPET
jgi:LacI family transcriptional regulator